MTTRREITANRRKVLTGNRRRWIYDVLTAAGPLMVGYGLITDTQLGLWLGVAAAILSAGGFNLARRNIHDGDA